MDKLFLVHGMGLQKEGWEQPLRTHLGTLFSKYTNLGTDKLEDLFDVIPVQYDVVFRDLLNQWQNNAAAFGGAELPAAPPVQQLTGWLTDAGNDANKLWTHPVDVLLYRFFPDVRSAVKTKVALQFAQVLASLRADENWMVVAHSLGTCVTHDSLDMLFQGTLPAGAPTGLDPTKRQAQAIVMVANVSRVLQTNTKVYQSTVMPGQSGQAGRGCLRYLTTYHRLDPFTWVDPFRPEIWPDQATWDKGLYEFLEVDHIWDWNVHDAVHYLQNPKAFVPVLRALTYRRAVSKAVEADAIKSFNRFGSLTADDVTKIKTWLEDKLPSEPNWKALVNSAEWFFAPPNEIRETGGGS